MRAAVMSYCLKNALPENEQTMENILRLASKEGIENIEIYAGQWQFEGDIRKVTESLRNIADSVGVKLPVYGSGTRVGHIGPLIGCLELNLQTQDLVNTCPDYFGRYWLEQAVRHHGIAHLLFHPAHIEEPGVADALRMVVNYGRQHGFEWWTCAQINDWERARRGVRLKSYQRRHNGMTYCFAAERPLQNATLLFLNSRAEKERVERYGFTFHKVEIDLEGEKEVGLE